MALFVVAMKILIAVGTYDLSMSSILVSSQVDLHFCDAVSSSLKR
jgi:hypothetical protein